MSDQPPVVYILHGEDEFAIHRSIADIQKKMGDEPTATMNVTRLDGRVDGKDEFVTAVCSMPLMVNRRLVVLKNPLFQINSSNDREEFLSRLDLVPPSTALVLVFDKFLAGSKSRKARKTHWLEKWAQANPEKVYVRAFPTPRGPAMREWIIKYAGERDGIITPQAATILSKLIGSDTRRASQEIEKLLAYVNYERDVEVEDVEHLCPYRESIKDFALANAVRMRDRNEAMRVLHEMLEEDDPVKILGGIVYQIRLLLLSRHALNDGTRAQDAVKRLTDELRVSPYPARLAVEQAQRFSTRFLENIYRELLNIDVSIKTGRMDGKLALEAFIARFAGV